MSDKDGGPAFPETENYGRSGMTLRDWFAGQAVVGMRANPANELAAHVSSWAYAIADSMLKERQK